MNARSGSALLVVAPAKVVRMLVWIAAALALISLVAEFSVHLTGHDSVLGLVQLVSLKVHPSIPLWFQYSVFLFCALAAGAVAWVKLRTGELTWVNHWSALAIVFVCLSLDEAIGIHQAWSSPLREAFGLDGIFYFAWVIPGAVLAAITAFAFAGFATALPAATRRLLIAGGGAYLAGALGVEMMQARHYRLYGPDFGYAMIWHAGEILEMAGMLLALYAIVSYLVTVLHDRILEFERAPAQRAPGDDA